MQYEDISFDDNDWNLFQVDDPRLRADALRHSVLPRLHLVINECISHINKVYSTEPLDDSTVTYYPQFRPKRSKELNFLYDAAFVGIAGKRVKGKWFGVERRNRKPVQVLPFRFGFQLTQDGLRIVFQNYWITGLSDISFEKYLSFHLEFEELTHRLCYWSGIDPFLFYGDGTQPISTFKQHYKYMIESKTFENSFTSRNYRDFPISPASIEQLVVDYVFFYPIYDSYLRISEGKPVRFLELIEKANNWLVSEMVKPQDEPHKISETYSQEVLLQARQAAEKRVKVMPSLRWQVFQRDDWKCVACGKGSRHDAILHVDHIVPRSKGGKDVIENYQTLCSLCNVGKSNKDDTDLRFRK